jgi:hypothetical protein
MSAGRARLKDGGAPPFSSADQAAVLRSRRRWPPKKIVTPTAAKAVAGKPAILDPVSPDRRQPCCQFRQQEAPMQIIATPTVDHANYLAAIACAERRALHSFFDQHVIENGEDDYIAIDEGDYGALPMRLIDRVVHTVPGRMSDEF